MKGRILISLLLCFVLIISAFSFLGCSESNSEGYTLSDDGTYYTFTGIKNLAETEYTFLSEIDGIPVTQIKANAFSQNFTIKKVIIPDSITKMGSNAFSKCAELTEVTIGSGLDTIPESAFAFCNKLTTVTFSTGLQKISKSAFANCLKLDNVTLPTTLTTLCEKAFLKCRGLKSIVLPENLTKIENSCFEECTSLTSVTINKALTEISNSCFKKCSKLTTINFAMDGVLEVIGNSAFLNSAVTELTFPDSLKGIKESAFYNCKQLRKVTFGKGITFIGGSTSTSVGGTFCDDDAETVHVTEFVFPEEALGYGWYPSHDGWGSSGTRQYWFEFWPDGTPHNVGSHDSYFLTPEELRNNEACMTLAQTMGSWAWFKCTTPDPEYAL
ncbi:MAG: leucine-rich repeat domain-containing protein [Clostridia bacterium]|nr:leucine-rich repeat domain-containing protein [Clostridia bacterium]